MSSGEKAWSIRNIELHVLWTTPRNLLQFLPWLFIPIVKIEIHKKMYTMFTCLTGNCSIVLKIQWMNWSRKGFRKRVLLCTVSDYNFVEGKSQNNTIYRLYFDLPTEFSYQWENARQKLPALLCIVLLSFRCCIAWYWFTLWNVKRLVDMKGTLWWVLAIVHILRLISRCSPMHHLLKL